MSQNYAAVVAVVLSVICCTSCVDAGEPTTPKAKSPTAKAVRSECYVPSDVVGRCYWTEEEIRSQMEGPDVQFLWPKGDGTWSFDERTGVLTIETHKMPWLKSRQIPSNLAEYLPQLRALLEIGSPDAEDYMFALFAFEAFCDDDHVVDLDDGWFDRNWYWVKSRSVEDRALLVYLLERRGFTKESDFDSELSYLGYGYIKGSLGKGAATALASAKAKYFPGVCKVAGTGR